MEENMKRIMDYLLKKNPELGDLKSRFSLDFDQ